MPDRLPDADGTDEATPRWVKVAGVVAIAAVVLIVLAILAGGHGPGRHAASEAGAPAGAQPR